MFSSGYAAVARSALPVPGFAYLPGRGLQRFGAPPCLIRPLQGACPHDRMSDGRSNRVSGRSELPFSVAVVVKDAVLAGLDHGIFRDEPEATVSCCRPRIIRPSRRQEDGTSAVAPGHSPRWQSSAGTDCRPLTHAEVNVMLATFQTRSAERCAVESLCGCQRLRLPGRSAHASRS